jgi:mannose-6-phosphate isomerase-like protein (cupin superfamily)
MTEVSVVAPDGGEAIQLGPIQMRILEDGRTTGHRLGVGEITIPPGTAGPPQHRHAQHDEGFYVVSGTARFTVGDASYEATPGTLVVIRPVPRTPSPTPARSRLSCSTPSRPICTCGTSATWAR